MQLGSGPLKRPRGPAMIRPFTRTLERMRPIARIENQAGNWSQTRFSLWRTTNLRPEASSRRLEEWHPTCLSYRWRKIMHLYGKGVFNQQDEAARSKKQHAGSPKSGKRLQAIAMALLTVSAGMPSGYAQQQQQGGAGSKRP